MKNETVNTILKRARNARLSGKTTYKTFNGLEIIRHDFDLNPDIIKGFQKMTIHYHYVHLTGGKKLKKVDKISFREGSPEAINSQLADLGLSMSKLKKNKPLFSEAFDAFYTCKKKDMIISGGILKKTGLAELSYSFKNIKLNNGKPSTLNDIFEKEIQWKLNQEMVPEPSSAYPIEKTAMIKDRETKGSHYLLYHYFPSLPRKGKGFDSIHKSQDIVFTGLLEAMDFFFGPMKQGWKPNNDGQHKEVYEYNGRHTVQWIHAARKLMGSDLIFFVGTSLLPGERPVVEVKILYSRP